MLLPLVTLDPTPCTHAENSSMNNSTEILAIEETEKQVNSMISELGTMEESAGESKPSTEEGQNGEE